MFFPRVSLKMALAMTKLLKEKRIWLSTFLLSLWTLLSLPKHLCGRIALDSWILAEICPEILEHRATLMTFKMLNKSFGWTISFQNF